MKFRKLPVEIEAVQFRGNNFEEVMEFCPTAKIFSYGTRQDSPSMIIPTLEGEMKVSINDWIIKGVAGEFYPCKPNIFYETYEPI